jgi:hypothetical protein
MRFSCWHQVRNFLKPDVAKITITFLLTYFSFGFFHYVLIGGGSIAYNFLVGSLYVLFYKPTPLVLMFLVVLVSYVLSCVIANVTYFFVPSFSKFKLSILALFIAFSSIFVLDAILTYSRPSSSPAEKVLVKVCLATGKRYCEVWSTCGYKDSCKPGNMTFERYSPDCSKIYNITQNTCTELLRS